MAIATGTALAIASMAAGAGSSIYSTKKRADAEKKAYRQAQLARENRFLFSPEERAAARQLLFRSLMGGQMGGHMPQVPRPGTQGVPRDASPQALQMAQFMKMVMDRYQQPSASYQGYLQGLQERRDARAGVAEPPPQGAGAVSAQRRQPNQGGRSY